MTFRVGQKVICVDDEQPRIRIRPVVRGGVYTIRDIGEEPLYPGQYWVLLEEIRNTARDALGELAYRTSRFRPIVERNTDISFAHEILKKASKKQGADA